MCFYFAFQCVATILNFLFFVSVIIMSAVFYGLGAESMRTFSDSFLFILIAGILIVCCQLYVIITPVSAIATKRILDGKPLTFFQKISGIIFPIITIPLYILVILKY